ncbi:HNH endonuclease signature motif containing protein [Actinomycetospora lemnae]|uniref:DUF222 domain-containing protein n=1 Tax=Actinomycetospora lemnae TaxID=3019891 RepID=A0ABT5SZS1_9PSEU|nr:HNH endonuclease signature motif containing protein [Actinomycetospora sp. DW7H6]MDD7968369.1 DUF222 domain-containing protein [Actinomycetospora sp. DW7H6]
MSIDHDLRPGLAAELDALAPGAELVAALERLSPAALTGEDLAAYLRACQRATSRGVARLLDGMHHLGRAQADRVDRRDGLDEFSGDEVAAVLGWGRTMTSRRLDLADDLQDRLPDVGDALWHGAIDEYKATRFSEGTCDLADDHARHVCRVLLPEAAELPPAELARRIEQVATALDPEWAARRAARAEKNARVILSPNPTGTATFSVCDIAAPSGLAMRDRCDALAAAVRHLGVLTPIGSLRAQVAERLLDGSVAGLDDHKVALLLAAEYHEHNRPDSSTTTDDASAAQEPDHERDQCSDDHHGSDNGPGDDGRGRGDQGPDDDGPDDGPDDDDPGRDDDGPGDDEPDDDPDDRSGGPVADGAEDEACSDADGVGKALAPADHPCEQGVLDLPDLADLPAPALPPTIEGADPGPGRPRCGTSELRLRLTTALGLDDLPATVPGYGNLLAHHARTMLTAHHSGEWRIVLADDEGRLQHVLLARRRPRRPVQPPEPRGRGRVEQCTAIVELQVPTTLAAALDPRAHPAWSGFIAEVQRRLDELGGHSPAGPYETTADHLRRRPRVEIDRWVRVRDRHCVAPGCRRSARRADLDHTLDWACDGITSHTNLGVLDRHHHRAKHVAGWKVDQPSPGLFAFRTRAGVHHTTHPKRIIEPLPRPRPARRPRPLPDDGPVVDPGLDLSHESDAAEEDAWRRRFLRRTGMTAETTSTPPPRHADDDPPPF